RAPPASSCRPGRTEPRGGSASKDSPARNRETRRETLAPKGSGISELVSPHAAVDGNDRSGDIAREGRDQEADQVRDILGLAVFAERNLLPLFLCPPFRAVVAADLLAVDAPGWNRVHGDAVPAELAREPFRPGVHRRLRGKGAVQSFRLGLARDVDDPP